MVANMNFCTRLGTGSILASLSFAVLRHAGYASAALSFDLKPHEKWIDGNTGLERVLQKRGTIDSLLDNDAENTLQFYVDLTVGTPPQPIHFTVNTAPWTWVPAPLSKGFCDNATGNSSCTYSNASGYFDITKSTTFQNQSDAFAATYADNSIATGIYGLDTVLIGQISITNTSIGVAKNWTTYPSLGIGLSKDASVPYNPIPVTMLNEGLINTISYGLYLNDVRAKQGQIVFGGVDIDKYEGDLMTFNSSDVTTVTQTGLNIITSLGGNTSVSSATISAKASLQFGTSSLYLPAAMIPPVVEAMGAALDSQTGFYTVDCDADFSKISSLEFVFDGLVIEMAIEQLLYNVEAELSDGSPECFVLLRSSALLSAPAEIILGVPFLRSAYVFFDFTNNQTSLAPAILNATGINIVEVPAKNNALSIFNPKDPTGSGAPSSTVTASTPTSTANSTSSSPAATTSPASSGKKSHIGAIAGGVVGGIGGLALVAILILLLLRHKKKMANMDMPVAPPANDQFNQPQHGYYPPNGPQDPNKYQNPMSEVDGTSAVGNAWGTHPLPAQNYAPVELSANR